VTKSGATSAGSRNTTLTMAGDQHLSNVQVVGTSWEAIQIGDVSTIGYVYARNQDATNFVQLALANDGSGIFAKLIAGDVAIFPAQTATMYAKADTANCNVHFVVIEL
jgi:hypothetical protein